MSGPWPGGKGDRPRPFNKARFDENYDKIFGDKKCKTVAKDDSLRQEPSETVAGISPVPISSPPTPISEKGNG
jgi:hypothetical protein